MKKFQFLIISIVVMFFSFAVNAGEEHERLIRDTEIENTLRLFMKPLLYSANLVQRDEDLERLEVYILQSDTVNAFTFGGLTLVVTTGLLSKMGPEEAMGIFAHETGHMLSKHVLVRYEAMENAMRSSLLGMLVGVGAGILNPMAGIAIISGISEVTKRGVLSYSRSQESSADQSALRLLEANHFTASGLEKTFKYFEKQSFLPDYSKIEYLLTHPMPENRLTSISEHIKTSPYTNAPLPEKYTKPYRRIQAKILAYVHPQQALRKFDQDESVNAKYAKMIAYMELGKLRDFDAVRKDLAPVLGSDPYFIEIEAQSAFEYGQIPKSITLYKKVLKKLPHAPLIQIALAHALIENQDSKADYARALRLLKQANAIDPTPFAWRMIAIASGRMGDEGQAAYALAEEAVLVGDKAAAKQQIHRAMQKLDKASPFYRRAMDIKLTLDDLH